MDISVLFMMLFVFSWGCFLMDLETKQAKEIMRGAVPPMILLTCVVMILGINAMPMGGFFASVGVARTIHSIFPKEATKKT